MRVIIMQGIPGSGKSIWVRDHWPTAVVCSADDFWGDETGEYRFDPARLTEAHDWCLRRYLRRLNPEWASDVVPEGAVLIVDNTNLSVWEVAPYYRLAEALGHEVEIVRVECPPDVAAERNVHGVPAWKVGAMWVTLQECRLPPWWKLTSIPYQEVEECA